MKAIPRVLLVLACLVAVSPAQQEGPATADPRPAAGAAQVQNPFQAFDRAAFEARCKQLGATEPQLQAFASQVAELGLTRAADNLVRAIHAPLDAAVKLREANDPKAALELAKVITGASDPALQAHARYHLARVFLDSDDPERAVEILNEYLQKNINTSAMDAEAAYFYAQCLAEIPRPELAVPRFRAFLQWFPDASERFRSAAQQRILELETQMDSRLHVLADGMKKTTRDLKKQKTDKPVQVDQDGYIEELNQLIEMYEEMEKKKSGAPSGNQQSSSPASKSALVDGQARIGDLQKNRTIADRWGEMKDRDRKKIESAVQEGLPPQYRKMLEEYYKKLGTGENK